MTAWPSVGVVLPTTGTRPDRLRAAVQAVLAQDYPAPVQAVVVHDGCEPGNGYAPDAGVTVLANARSAGLAGARNTGVLALDTELVAFCDDDDAWLPGKLRCQVEALLAEPRADFASCGIVISYRGALRPRLAGRDRISHRDLLRSRMVMVHSSTYMARRAALLDGIGLLDEDIPGGQGEDWDLALRASARHPIVHVDRPLVRVTWGNSHFTRQWDTYAAAMHWMLDHHPDLAACRPGAARVYGQIAFASACLGRRADAARSASLAFRRNWHERRVPIALAVAAGLVSGDRVLRVLNARGHGI